MPRVILDERQTTALISQAELQNIFAYVKQFKPESVELDPIMYPFLPDFIAAVGDVDALIKIPPPESAHSDTTPSTGAENAASQRTDEAQEPVPAIAPASEKFFNDLGLSIVDEPAIKQSDPAVLHYQLISLLKAPGAGANTLSAQPTAANTPNTSTLNAGASIYDSMGRGTAAGGDNILASTNAAFKSPVHSATVHKIAHGDTRRLEEWITSTRSADWTSRRVIDYAPQGEYPPIEELMEAWEQDFDQKVSEDLVERALAPTIDMPLEDYARLLSYLVGIPVHANVPSASGANKSAIEALSCLFELYHSFSANQHFGGAESS